MYVLPQGHMEDMVCISIPFIVPLIHISGGSLSSNTICDDNCCCLFLAAISGYGYSYAAVIVAMVIAITVAVSVAIVVAMNRLQLLLWL